FVALLVRQVPVFQLFTQEVGLESVETQNRGPVANSIKVVITERVKLFVDPVLAVDNQRLVFRDVILLAEIFKNRWHLGLETVCKWFVRDILVMIETAGDQVQRALAVAGIDTGSGGDIDLVEQDALFFHQLVIDERAMSFLWELNSFLPANTAAE